MILPIEASDALDALRRAREDLGAAVDALHAVYAPVSVSSRFVRAHDAVSGIVEEVAAAVAAADRDRRMEDVEERHVECQTFPWADDL